MSDLLHDGQSVERCCPDHPVERLVVRRNRATDTQFLGCPLWPACNYTTPIPADILMRALAHTGIIALIDEVTGYQSQRPPDALTKILEAFIAKELQPYVKTFPSDFYEHLFRLRGLNYKTDSVERPLYFGCLTNDIVYRRLAPGVLAELKKITLRNEAGRPKHKYFQRLTHNLGYPKLREHLGGVVDIMKLSSDYGDFLSKLDRLHPRYGQMYLLPIGFDPAKDNGMGL